MIVTIDGPAGSGKSTIAKALAERLGWTYLDTGAMYRAVALLAQNDHLDVSQVGQIAKLAEKAKITFNPSQAGLTVYLNGEDVTDRLRNESVSELASKLATHPDIRSVLVQKQRQLAQQHDHVVTEGRDQGSVVFPDAELKIYLDASVSERAQRRYDQLIGQGACAEIDQIRQAIKQRDQRDKSRSTGPLVVPESAVIIDTTHMTPEKVLEHIIKHIDKRRDKD